MFFIAGDNWVDRFGELRGEGLDQQQACCATSRWTSALRRRHHQSACVGQKECHRHFGRKQTAAGAGDCRAI